MFKLAIFDLDGTLLNLNHDISKENIHALQTLQASGCQTIIATGRPDMLVKEYVKTLGLNEPVISCNGSMIRNPLTGEIIYQKTLPRNVVEKVVKKCIDDQHIFMIYTSNAIITTDNYRMRYFEERNKTLSPDCRVTFIVTEDLEEIIKHDAYKILIIEKDEEKYLTLKEKFFDLEAYTVSSAKGFFDVMPTGTSKREAIKLISHHYDVEQKDIVAFGDNYNDIEMLDYAGTAITTENAVPEVKKMADYISLDHNDHGVAYAIHHYILDKQEA